MICAHRHHLRTSSKLIGFQGINSRQQAARRARHDVKRRSPFANPPSRSVSVQGSATSGNPSKQPLQPCPLSAILFSLPNHTHSRLTSERWCLRTKDPVGFSIHPRSPFSSKWISVLLSIFENIVDAMVEAVN
jgi:hypothetical protein